MTTPERAANDGGLDEISERVEGGELVDLMTAPRRKGGEVDDFFLSQQPQNDEGNAVRLRTRFGDRLIAVRNRGWHAYNGRFWDNLTGEDEAVRAAHMVGRLIRSEEVPAVFDTVDRDSAAGRMKEGRAKALKVGAMELKEFAVQSGNRSRVAGMLQMAEPYLRREVGDLDAHEWLFNVENGTLVLDRQTGEHDIREHRREDMLTRMAATAYDPEAECPVWDECLARWMPDHLEREFLMQWAGYCLTGSQEEQKILLMTGVGGNGKSVYLDVYSGMMGSYAQHVPIATFLTQKHGAGGGDATPDLMLLPGARLVTASEPESGESTTFNDSIIKSLTGEEKMSGRNLYERSMTRFYNKGKVTLGMNDVPRFKGNDNGIWRRLLILMWGAVITEEEKAKYPNLIATLAAERAGILNWALEGFKRWVENGRKLQIPDSIRAEVAEAKEYAAPIKYFIDHFCQADPGGGITSAKLYRAYCNYLKDQGEPHPEQVTKQRAFGTILRNSLKIRPKKSSSIVYPLKLTAAGERDYGDGRAEEAGTGRPLGTHRE